MGGWFAALVVNKGLAWFFDGFNKTFDVTIKGYGAAVGVLVRTAPLVLLAYGALMGLTFQGFRTVPVGFIPEQDKGYLVVNAQLPDGASLERTEAVVARLRNIALETPGVEHTISVPGYSIVLSTNLSNVGGMFVILKPFEERKGYKTLGAPEVMKKLRQRFAEIQEARIAVFGAPPVDGLGSTGGFKLQVQDRGGSGPAALEGGVQTLAAEGNAQRGRLTGRTSVWFSKRHPNECGRSFTAGGNSPIILFNTEWISSSGMEASRGRRRFSLASNRPASWRPLRSRGGRRPTAALACGISRCGNRYA